MQRAHLRAFACAVAWVLAGLVAAFVASAQDAPPPRPELVVQTGHQNQIGPVVFSADSRILASGDIRGSIRIWETATGKQLRALPGHVEDVSKLRFSRDGRWLASAEGGFDAATVKTWEVATGRELRSFSFPGSRVTALTMSADGTLIAAAADDVRIWSLASGEQIAQIPTDNSRVTLAFAPGSNVLAIRSPFSVRFWAPNEIEAASIRLRGFSGEREMIFLSDGQRLAVPDDDKIVVVDMPKRKASGRIAASFEARLFSLSDAGSELVVRIGDRYEVWDVVTRRKVREMARKYDESDEVPSPSWRWMATPNGSSLKVEDLDGGRDALLLGGHLANAGAVAFSPDGSRLATKTGKRFWVWDLNSGEPPRLFDGHHLPGGLEIDALSFSGDGKHLVSGDQGVNILEWDVASGKVSNSIALTLDKSVITHACSADGRWCVSGDFGRIDVREAATWRVYRTFEASIGSSGLALSDDGHWIAGSAAAQSVAIWDRTNGRYRQFEGHSDIVHGVAFSPGGRRLASIDFSGEVKVWEVESGRELFGFAAGDTSPCVAFSPDDRTLATGSSVGTIRLWDSDSGRLLHTLEGHADWIAKLSFSPDGRKLASGSKDGTIRIWDVEKGTPIALLTAAKDSEDWLVVTPDGRFDGSAGADALVAWRIGDSAYSPDRYSKNFFTPGLLARVWRGGRGAAPGAVVELEGITAPPVIRILETSGRALTQPKLSLRMRVEGPAAEVSLYQNGARVATQPGTSGAATEYTFDVNLISGENELRAVAVSRGGVWSNPDSIRLSYDAPPAKPALHVLTIGVSRYLEPHWNLAFARADAEAIANFFAKRSAKLFEPVEATVLSDENASRANIQATIASIGARARPEDVVLIYFAGHGVAIDQTYFMLPYEMRDEASLEADVKKFGLSDRALLDSLRKIKALKKIVILDACQSGGALDILGRTPAAERGALEMLVRAEGLFIIAASTRQQEAMEVRELGHGILTYALLSGLGGMDDATVPAVITMHQLLAYIGQKVPELAARYGRGTRQIPVSRNRGMDFPLAVH